MPEDASLRRLRSIARAGGGGVLLAVVLVLAFPPFDLWWLAPLAPAVLAVAAVRCGVWAIVVGLGVPAAAAWTWHSWWVGGISVAGLVPLVLYLAAWTPLTALVLARIARRGPGRDWPLAVLVPLVWVGMETWRALVVFDGYPWYLIGQPLIGWLPLAQVADLGGICLVGVLPAAVGGWVADLVLRRGSARRRGLATLGVALLLGVWVGYGLLRMRSPDAGSVGPRILAMQTDLPQSLKVGWSPERQWRDALRFSERTLDAVATLEAEGRGVDLVAWPETMLPGVGLEPASTAVLSGGGWWPGTRFADLAVDLQNRLDAPLLLGSGSFEGLRVQGDRLDWDARFNSVYLLDERGPAAATRYDKLVLTPFGERMPYISAWPWLEARLLSIGAAGMAFDLDAGRTIAPLEFAWEADDGPRAVGIATPICFEDTVSGVCRRLVWRSGRRVASVIVNASNDGWFGDWTPARASHFEFARFRAIENRTPLVRVVNTGDSGWIDSDGRIVDRLAGPAPGWVLATPRLDDRRPLYAMVGDVPMMGWAVVLVLVVAWSLRRRAVGDPDAGPAAGDG